MVKWKCFLGFHKWKFITWAEYAYSLNAWNQRVRKQSVNKCECCGKYSKAPEWYKKEYRKMYPFVGHDGFQKDWQPEIKEIAYAQVIFDKYFNLENNITIEFNRQTKKGVENFRCFAPVSERLLMYSNEIEMSGLQYIDENFVKPANPFKIVLKEARIKVGLSTIQVAEYGKFYGKVNHGGSVANWENGDNIPTIEQWQKLSEIIPLGKGSEIQLNYNKLLLEYQNLRQEHDSKRRTFNNYLKLFDVMNFDQEAHITKNYDHDTCKPETLTRALILTCSRPNDTVLIPFSGSGTECAMCAKEKRNFIGFDVTEKYVTMGNDRCIEVFKTPSLF